MSAADGICDAAGAKFSERYAGQEKMVLLTADVQKGYGYWLAREWMKNGDSGLMDWGQWSSWSQLNDQANKHKANWVLVDAGYGERTQETYEACWKYKFLPTMGKENIPDLLFTQSQLNPFEGTRRQSEGRRKQIAILYFRTDPFKSQLVSRIRGQTEFAWYVYHNIELDYILQATSEQRLDGKWIAHGANHLWDCEVLQLLGATRFGFNRFRGFSADKPSAPGII